jgi:polyhydroxyalkanoate synthesis regulator phasin
MTNDLCLQKEAVVFDLIKKTLLTGIGLALQTRDEVEELAKEFANRGKMSEKEGMKFIEELLNRYDDTRNMLETRIEKAVKELLKKADIVTSDELKALKKEIRELKNAISKEKNAS